MTTRSRVVLYDQHPKLTDSKSEILSGLNQPQKQLPAKYFYDKNGSELFEEITRLPEYYPTRTEIQLLKRNSHKIANIVGKKTCLIEYGSGASTKIRIILDCLKPRCYIPMDISADFLLQSSERLAEDFPWLTINATCVDYSQPFEIPNGISNNDQRLGFFPGSSIGNFTPDQASKFLNQCHQTLGGNSYLLVGVDLWKDTDVLHPAYDDSAGVTAKFNKNILLNINKLLCGNFNPDNFDHQIKIDSQKKRVEMHLVSKIDQVARLDNKSIIIRKNESIHTENSYKYTVESFSKMSEEANFEVVNSWQDSDQLFSLFLLQAK